MTDPLLTDREREVAALVAAKRTNKQIAAELGISDGRVRHLIASAAFRIGAHPSDDFRVALALWWERAAA